MEQPQNKIPRFVKASIQKHRPQQPLKRARPRALPLAASMFFFALAHNPMPPQPKLARVLGKRAAVDQFRPRLGQRAFAETRESLVELARQSQLQHRIAEKLQALV